MTNSNDGTLNPSQVRTAGMPKRDRMIVENASLARMLAVKFKDRGEPLEDLVQVAMIGLINAVDRFDPSRDVKFATYATPTVIGELRRYFRDKASPLHGSRYLKELNYALFMTQERFMAAQGREPTVSELAAATGESEQTVLDALVLRRVLTTVSLETGFEGNEDDEYAPFERLGTEDRNLHEFIGLADIRQAVERIKEPRTRLALTLHFFDEVSQSEIALMLGCPQMQVSRLLEAALGELHNALLDSEEEDGLRFAGEPTAAGQEPELAPITPRPRPEQSAALNKKLIGALDDILAQETDQ